MPSFDLLPPETSGVLEQVCETIKKTFPVPGRFRSALPSNIAELSRLLTNGRGDRSLSYLARPNFLSAYLYYFLPWNIYRLCLLLPHLDLPLTSNSVITDMGSGPLTFASALFIARPDLRKIPLEINCIDRISPALDAGKKFFAALLSAMDNTGIPWKINIIREDVDIRRAYLTRKRKSASLVCAVNMFNEIYERLPHSDVEGLRKMAANAARTMHNEAEPNASILTVEPGVPQSGRFVSFLRTAFMKLDRAPVSPCPHIASCPMTGGASFGGKKKWCHFAFEVLGAPKELQSLSAAAKIPKERLALSFLLTGACSSQSSLPQNAAKTKVRVISDAFPLPDKLFGRYGCSSEGLVLLTGEKSKIEKTSSLSLVSPVFAADGRRDKKSGALIASLSGETQ